MLGLWVKTGAAAWSRTRLWTTVTLCSGLGTFPGPGLRHLRDALFWASFRLRESSLGLNVYQTSHQVEVTHCGQAGASGRDFSFVLLLALSYSLLFVSRAPASPERFFFLSIISLEFCATSYSGNTTSLIVGLTLSFFFSCLSDSTTMSSTSCCRRAEWSRCSLRKVLNLRP